MTNGRPPEIYECECGGSWSVSSVMPDDLRDLLAALGMSTAAQPKTPHLVMRDAIEEARRLMGRLADHLSDGHSHG